MFPDFFGVESYLGVTNFKPRLVPGDPPGGVPGVPVGWFLDSNFEAVDF